MKQFFKNFVKNCGNLITEAFKCHFKNLFGLIIKVCFFKRILPNTQDLKVINLRASNV